MAAGCLLVLEAGGIASDFAGGNDFLANGNILAANPRIHEAMLARIQTQLPAELRR